MRKLVALSFAWRARPGQAEPGIATDRDTSALSRRRQCAHRTRLRPQLGYNAEPVLRAYCTTGLSGGYGVVTSTDKLTATLALPNPFSVSRDIWLVIVNNKSGPVTDYILRIVP